MKESVVGVMVLLGRFCALVASGDYPEASMFLRDSGGLSRTWLETAVDMEWLTPAQAGEFLPWFEGSIHGLDEREFIDRMWPVEADPDNSDVE